MGQKTGKTTSERDKTLYKFIEGTFSWAIKDRAGKNKAARSKEIYGFTNELVFPSEKGI